MSVIVETPRAVAKRCRSAGALIIRCKIACQDGDAFISFPFENITFSIVSVLWHHHHSRGNELSQPAGSWNTGIRSEINYDKLTNNTMRTSGAVYAQAYYRCRR